MLIWKETLVVFRRQMRLALQSPAWVIIGLLQPILYLVLFGPLLKPVADRVGAGNPYALFVPGLLIQLGLFSTLFAGFGLIAELRAGVVEAERVTPASRTALLIGRILRYVVQLTVQGAVLIAVGFAFGLVGSIIGMTLGLLLMSLFGAACAAASYALALTLKNEAIMAPLINCIALPIILLSGVLIPMSFAPNWLDSFSNFMPTKYIVNAIRELFVGDLWSTTTIWGVFWTAVLLVTGLYAGTRTFRQENA